MKGIPDDISALKSFVEQLLKKIDRLEKENAELRRRLGLNSGNSDKPPSCDGYGKKTVKPGLPKEGKRTNGGQKGHEGYTLKRTELPDYTALHLPGQCSRCGRRFGDAEFFEVIQGRQVFDIPAPKLEVTEHRIGRIVCCGRAHDGEYPAAVTASVQYGSGVRALVTKLSVDCRMPMEQISGLFEDMYGYPLNTATVEDALQRAYELSAPVEEKIRSALLNSETVHFDETGIRAAGKLHWLHTASTGRYTHLFIHDKRGGTALESESSVLKYFTGNAVHDCWSPYFRFSGARHILCGAHLLRELAGLTENGSLWAEEMHEFLLDLYKMPHPVAAADEVRRHYHVISAHADAEEPPPQQGRNGKPKHSAGRNLLNRLKKHEEGVLAFALEEDVPFTNNQAERDLRPAKVKQKVSGCFRTENGAQVYARLQAIISTFRKQGLKIFASLRELFSHRPVTVC
jgi:transposase